MLKYQNIAIQRIATLIKNIVLSRLEVTALTNNKRMILINSITRGFQDPIQSYKNEFCIYEWGIVNFKKSRANSSTRRISPLAILQAELGLLPK
jgi:hypothetical protein